MYIYNCNFFKAVVNFRFETFISEDKKEKFDTRVLFNRGHSGTAKFVIYREISRNLPMESVQTEDLVLLAH